MKNIKLIIFILITLTISSCSKKLLPGSKSLESENESKQAAFDYVYVEALKEKTLGNQGDALKYLEQCLKIDPNSDAAYYQMAQIVLNTGNLKSGKSLLEKAIKINEENIWYLMMMASIYFQEKNIDSTIIYYEKAVKYFHDREDVKLNLGDLYTENKQFEKAKDLYNGLEKEYGENEKTSISTIRVLMLETKYNEALNKIEVLLKNNPDELLYNGLLAEIYRGLGRKDDALNVYGKMIENNPDDAKTQLSLCDFLIVEKRYDELIKILDVVLINNEIAVEDKISLMARLVEIKDFSEKYENRILIELMILEAGYKDNGIVGLLRPELYINNGKIVEASKRLEEIVKLYPENYYAWEKLLMVYLQMKDYKMLMLRGEECSTKFNRSYIAKILYANGAIETGKYDIALNELSKAEILAGTDTDQLSQVINMRADIYYRMKDYNKAFDTFDKALKLNENDIIVINNYAYYLAEQGKDLKEAEKMAKSVIEKEKENSTYLDTYAWVLYKRGKIKEAEKVMEKIFSNSENNDAELYEHYGFILKEDKRCNDAIINWKKALEIDSSKNSLLKEIENCEK
jgi:tetratricopeptide (TPR) repeat protein